MPTGDATSVLTDGRLMELVRAERRDEAIELIIKAFRRKVFGLAYSFLHNREAAEDVAQEVFIRIWGALPTYDGRASVSTWIYAITRNASVSALRELRPLASLSDADIMSAVDVVETITSDEAATDSDALRRLVDQLPVKQRQVVVLFYMQEQSHEEIAAMLAMPVGTVKTLLHRARARLSAAVATGSAR
jgi:RNA polymerase sigma-70 factor (ECF subfamily)